MAGICELRIAELPGIRNNRISTPLWKRTGRSSAITVLSIPLGVPCMIRSVS